MTSIDKPTTPTYTSIGRPSDTFSPPIYNVSLILNNVSDTIDDYVQSIYMGISKPTTPTYTSISKPT